MCNAMQCAVAGSTRLAVRVRAVERERVLELAHDGRRAARRVDLHLDGAAEALGVVVVDVARVGVDAVAARLAVVDEEQAVPF